MDATLCSVASMFGGDRRFCSRGNRTNLLSAVSSAHGDLLKGAWEEEGKGEGNRSVSGWWWLESAFKRGKVPLMLHASATGSSGASPWWVYSSRRVPSPLIHLHLVACARASCYQISHAKHIYGSEAVSFALDNPAQEA